jgi:lysophospholipase L1-like esterase
LNNAADATLYGAAAPSGGAYSAYYGPSLVLGRSTLRRPIVASVSDSIFDGYSEDFHSNYQGPVVRACRANGFPMVKLSRGGETALSFNAASTRRFRSAMLAGCTHAIVEYGTNDGINSGSQVTNILARLAAIGTYLNGLGIKAWITTIPPRTTSTDSWVTTVNQTDVSLTANLATLNQAIRAQTGALSVYQGVIDLEGVCSSAQDSGKWGTSKTADGVHPTDALMRGAIQTLINGFVSTWSV